MSKIKGKIFISLLILFLTACSSNENTDSIQDDNPETTEEASDSKSTAETSQHGLSESPQADGEAAEESSVMEDRMMIYEAHIDLETEDYDQFQKNLQEQMNSFEAYMVETNINKTGNGTRQGHIRIRVPQQNFQSLLSGFENISDNIKSRNINSRDVTKSYVDFESRLKAKEEIEARLLSFLEDASATEDLIKISQDLERVQADIESIKGEMNYLENQSDFSTITLSITETKVVIDGVEQQNLNTWEKTKQAFFNSINGIVSLVSWITIVILGYSPFLIPLLVIGLFIWWQKKKKQKTE
ncbi:protein of unknown function [Halobacillus dabanensis]|uniref:DUF4349 domain-containing protein n=1 Tax=Halobacillus dabanensis TaxID=240302 RepID=A0A1I3T575_HALDA|nr:DUF4349 domain-containing protein [Halobacillus dabanensis]SFJ64981.1 protein of unknown function [Halobacillus dabanensis]